MAGSKLSDVADSIAHHHHPDSNSKDPDIATSMASNSDKNSAPMAAYHDKFAAMKKNHRSWISTIFSSSADIQPYLPIQLKMAIQAFFFISFMVYSSEAIALLRAHFHLVITVVSVLTFLTILASFYYTHHTPPCYLIDFCLTGREDNICASEVEFMEFIKSSGAFNEENLAFQNRVFLRSGIGEDSYAPPRLIQKLESVSMADARFETEALISIATTKLLKKLSMDPKDIDILILNSSLFNPSPSLTAFVVNNLKMRSNVKAFNLAGMGCSAGLVSIDLAKQLLKVHRNSNALVISTENITKNFYFGNDRSLLVSNCLFRCGCAAILLTNKRSCRSRAKMQLMHCLRTNLGADQKAYDCVHHMEDEEGKLGVALQVSLVEVAGNALRANITRLAPSILPVSEMLKVVISLIKKKVLKMSVKMYEPNFKKAIDHFCIHPGGRSVIQSIGKGLKLSDYDIEPGKMALNKFGNTSSSGIWYALAYCEAKGRLKKGDKVWQIALGSGFKCNSGVWKVLKDLDPSQSIGCNPWLPFIHKYPVPGTIEEQRKAQMEAEAGTAKTDVAKRDNICKPANHAC